MNEPLPAPWPVVPFPDFIVTAVILGALVLTGLGALTLVYLLIKDQRQNEIW